MEAGGGALGKIIMTQSELDATHLQIWSTPRHELGGLTLKEAAISGDDGARNRLHT